LRFIVRQLHVCETQPTESPRRILRKEEKERRKKEREIEREREREREGRGTRFVSIVSGPRISEFEFVVLSTDSIVIAYLRGACTPGTAISTYFMSRPHETRTWCTILTCSPVTRLRDVYRRWTRRIHAGPTCPFFSTRQWEFRWRPPSVTGIDI